jgi:Tol biopolymer transport system component
MQVNAGEVIVQHGDIFYREATQVRQLTTDTHNSDAVVSRDGKHIAYVHTIGEEAEIWLVDTDGNSPYRLVQSHVDNDPKKNLTNMNTLMFSNDGMAIYFLSEAWVTSNALHKFDLRTQKQSYITDANDITLPTKGKYAGYLVVNKHEYVQGGGSVDRDWLISPSGRKVRRWNH